MCISIKTPTRFLALALVAGLAACAKPATETAPEAGAEETAPPAAVVTKDQGPWEAGDLIASGQADIPNIEILEVHANGEGELCGMGKTATLKYVAMLADGTVKDPGTRPFSFKVGAGRAIKGWDVIVSKMRVGDSFTLILPQQLAYGPKDGDFKFDMELLSFK